MCACRCGPRRLIRDALALRYECRPPRCVACGLWSRLGKSANDRRRRRGRRQGRWVERGRGLSSSLSPECGGAAAKDIEAPPAAPTGSAGYGNGGGGEISAAAGLAVSEDLIDVDLVAGAGPDAGVAEATPTPGEDGVTAYQNGDSGAPGGHEASASGADGIARQLFDQAGGAAGACEVLE